MIGDVRHSYGFVVAVGPVTGKRFDISMAHNVLLQVTVLEKALVTAWPFANMFLGILVNSSLVISESALETETPSTPREVTLERLLSSVCKHVRLETWFLTRRKRENVNSISGQFRNVYIYLKAELQPGQVQM